MNEKLYIKMATQSLLFLFVIGALLFFPAGTFDYWEAWVFIAVFIACNIPITVWLALNDPQLLERRMRAGPAAETEESQKIIVTISFLSLAVAVLIPALDHRFGWSDVPTPVVILGDALMYTAALVFMIGIPLALGSWWGLLASALGVPALVWRILDEERLLKRDLPGYAEYIQRMRFRLIPGLF